MDGVEQTLTQEELEAKMAYVQKKEHVDRALEQVAAEKKKLEAEKAAFTAEQKRQTEELRQITEDATVTLDPKKVAEVVELIRNAEGDEAEAALAELLMATPKTSKDALKKSDVDSLVEEKLKTQQAAREEQERKAQEEALTQSIKSAEAKFEEDFKNEIGANRMESDFYDLAIVKYQKLAKDPVWNSKPLEEQFTKAGNLAKKQLGLDTTTVVDTKKSKQDLKEEITTTKAAGMKSEARSDEQKYQSRSDIVAEMKRERGQA